MVAALGHGAKLPRFATAAIARRTMLAARDEALAAVRAVAGTHGVVLDDTPESLRAIEAWYFALHGKRGGFARAGTDRRRFETAMGLYYAAVAVADAGATWVVQEFAFAPGTYELGLEAGLLAILGVDVMCHDWHLRSGNAQHRALLRDYRQHFPAKKRAKAARPAKRTRAKR
jgi:hypothetical protein